MVTIIDIDYVHSKIKRYGNEEGQGESERL